MALSKWWNGARRVDSRTFKTTMCITCRTLRTPSGSLYSPPKGSLARCISALLIGYMKVLYCYIFFHGRKVLFSLMRQTDIKMVIFNKIELSFSLYYVQIPAKRLFFFSIKCIIVSIIAPYCSIADNNYNMSNNTTNRHKMYIFHKIQLRFSLYYVQITAKILLLSLRKISRYSKISISDYCT